MPFVFSFRRSGLLPAALASVLIGCSMHPLPDDVSRTSTVDIVRSIRCEALAGLKSLGPELLKARPIIKATMVGYDFEFDTEETNNANGANGKPANGFLAFTRGDAFTLDVTGNAALRRHNVRRFKIIEPLTEVIKDEATCSDRTARANWVYPIAGTIGIDEVVRTYIKLEMLTELQKDQGSSAAGKFPSKNVVFSDDIDFTTHFQVSATTSLVLDAGIAGLKLTKASIAAGASRSDTHSVVVALTRAQVDVDEIPQNKNGAIKAKGDSKNMRAGLLASGSVRDPRSQAALIQVDEGARVRLAMELERRRGRKDDDKEPARALGERLLEVLKLP